MKRRATARWLGAAATRHHKRRIHLRAELVAKIAATITAPCEVSIQSTMPAGPRQLEMRAVQERLLVGCPAGRDVAGNAVLGDAVAEIDLTLPHQEGDHARAGLGGSGGWRARHERRHLTAWAQEAEGVGVPPADHRRGSTTRRSTRSARCRPAGVDGTLAVSQVPLCPVAVELDLVHPSVRQREHARAASDERAR